MQVNDIFQSLAGSPCTSSPHDTSSASDSEWATASDWSLADSRQSSRAPTPALAPPFPTTNGLTLHTSPEDAKVTPDFASWVKGGSALAPPSHPVFAQARQPSNWVLPVPRSSDVPSSSGTTTTRPRDRKHIPRPANAFMLFRAERVNADLPRDLPNRQQVVSVVAGQCWNMLDESEKAKWHARAQDMLKKHMETYPDYKFSPSRKTARKSKSEELEVKDGEEYIRHLREKYMRMMGPTVASPRPRRPKSRKPHVHPGVQAHHFSSTSGSLSSPIPPSAALVPTPVTSAAYPAGPTAALDLYRFPSHLFTPILPSQDPPTPFLATCPGFDIGAALSTTFMQVTHAGSGSKTAASPAGGSASDLELMGPGDVDAADKTPTAASFGNIAIPRSLATNLGGFASSTQMLGLHELALPYNIMSQWELQAQAPASPHPCKMHRDPAVACIPPLFSPDTRMEPQSPTEASLSTAPLTSIPAEVQETFGVKEGCA